MSNQIHHFETMEFRSFRHQEVDQTGLLCLQDLVGAGGSEAPKSVQEVVAELTSRLATWDDR